jgi:tetratricopeptide (TPR) repeat protein
MTNNLVLVSIFLIAFSSFAQPLSEAESRHLAASQQLLANGQYQQAQSRFEQLQQQYSRQRRPTAQAYALYYLSQVELQQQRYDAALKHLEQAYQLQQLAEPVQQQSLLMIAQLQLQTQQWQRAISSFQRWKAQSGETINYQLEYWLAQAQARAERWPAAAQSIQLALNQPSPAPLSWWQLAVVIYSQQQDWPAAIAAQQHILDARPEDMSAWWQITQLYLQHGQMQQAQAYLEQAHHLGLFSQAEHYRLLSKLMQQQNQPYQAARLVSEGMQRDLLSGQHQELCRLWLSAKEYARAAKCFEQHVKVHQDANSYQLLAYAQTQLGEFKASINSYQQANQLSGAMRAENYLQQGLLYLRLQHYNEAYQALKKAAAFPATATTSQQALDYLKQRQSLP